MYLGPISELMHVTEPFVPEENFVEFKIVIEKLKWYILYHQV
jgi:hypothetical protein